MFHYYIILILQKNTLCSEHKVGLSCLSVVLTSVTQNKTGLTVKLLQTISTINK